MVAANELSGQRVAVPPPPQVMHLAPTPSSASAVSHATFDIAHRPGRLDGPFCRSKFVGYRDFAPCLFAHKMAFSGGRHFGAGFKTEFLAEAGFTHFCKGFRGSVSCMMCQHRSLLGTDRVAALSDRHARASFKATLTPKAFSRCFRDMFRGLLLASVCGSNLGARLWRKFKATVAASQRRDVVAVPSLGRSQRVDKRLFVPHALVCQAPHKNLELKNILAVLVPSTLQVPVLVPARPQLAEVICPTNPERDRRAADVSLAVRGVHDGVNASVEFGNFRHGATPRATPDCTSDRR